MRWTIKRGYKCSLKLETQTSRGYPSPPPFLLLLSLLEEIIVGCGYRGLPSVESGSHIHLWVSWDSSPLPSPSQLFQSFISLHMPQSLPTLTWWPVLDFFHQVQIKQVSSITSSSQYHLSAFLENCFQFPGNNLDSPPKHRQGALLCIELSLWALTLILPRFCGQFLDLSHNPCSLLCAQSNYSGCTLSATFSPSFFSASSAWIICLPLHPLRCPNSETSKSLVLH